MNKTLTEQAMDAYLLNNDLGCASPRVGDQIAGLVWSYIEQVIEEGATDIDLIIEEACSRGQSEIGEIFEQDWADQQELDDDEEDEECDA